jgi:hypothetical protein
MTLGTFFRKRMAEVLPQNWEQHEHECFGVYEPGTGSTGWVAFRAFGFWGE